MGLSHQWPFRIQSLQSQRCRLQSSYSLHLSGCKSARFHPPRRHMVPDVWDARRKHRQSESAAQETAEILHFTKSPGSRGWGYSSEIMDMGLSNKNWQMSPENRVLTPIFRLKWPNIIFGTHYFQTNPYIYHIKMVVHPNYSQLHPFIGCVNSNFHFHNQSPSDHFLWAKTLYPFCSHQNCSFAMDIHPSEDAIYRYWPVTMYIYIYTPIKNMISSWTPMKNSSLLMVKFKSA